VPVVRAVEARYHAVNTLKAVFLERYSDGRDALQAESGSVYFSRPGRMRWEYESPEQKLFIADGKTVWFYVPADHTVTRAPMKESTDWRTPLALLTGKAKLSQLCDDIQVAKNTSDKQGNTILRCLPRGQKRPKESAEQNSDAALTDTSQAFDEVLLDVNSTTGELASVTIKQPGGIELEYRFGNWMENLPLSEALFHFQAPAGVAIVDESKALASAP
jgi:outer membrane lipoprotein carrier protein